MFKSFTHLLRFSYHAIRSYGGSFALLRKAWAIYKLEGRNGILRRLPLGRFKAIQTNTFIQQAYSTHDLISNEGLEKSPKGSIAIIIHAYYPDIFPTIVEAINNIPWSFDLYVSATNQEARQELLEQTKKIKKAKNIEIKITPNRGRDMAPFFVTYGNAIYSHDYLLHLHTKKSLYTGSERMQWRDHLLQGLLGSPRLIRQIFGQFQNYPQLGVIYPETFSSLPYWAHTWLQNKGIGLSLGGRLGIDISYRNYIDAPMGSMFWARSKALQPLLDLNLKYEDFPEEKGQTDGTLQHTLERFIVLSALKAGFSAQVLQRISAEETLFASPGGKNLEQYYSVTTKQRILALASSADIVSFDIFDTLFTRPWFAPDHLFSFLEQDVARRWRLQDYAHLRKQAEQLARQQHPACDVNLAQIYQAFIQLTGCSPEHAQEIQELECATELTTLQPNAAVVQAARQLAAQGKRLVLVSDMYLPASFLHQVLARHNLDFFESLYLSNELGARKDNGKMWEFLTKKEHIQPQRWLHIGDNEHSDIQNPVDRGYLHPVHVMRASDQLMLFNEEASQWITPQTWQEGLILGLLAHRLFTPKRSTSPIGLDWGSRQVRITSLHDLGYLVIGPALSVFMAWLIQRSQADGVQRLLYASREGHLLCQAHQSVQQHLQILGQNIPLGSYFLCSRPASGLAAIENQQDLELLLNAHFQGSFAQILQQRYCVQDLQPFEERLGKQALHAQCQLPEDYTDFLKLLTQCFDIIQIQAAQARENYQEYAKTQMHGQPSALVDIGYAGTIQKSLIRFLPEIVGGYYFVTTEKSASAKTQGKFAQGCFADNINPYHTQLPLYQYALFFEAVLTAPHGQLQGFDTQIQPIYKAQGHGQKYFAEIEQVHAGALDFLNDVLRITGLNFTQLAEQQSATQLPIRQLMQQRWLLDCPQNFLQVEDDFSGNSEISVFEFYERKRLRLPGVLD